MKLIRQLFVLSIGFLVVGSAYAKALTGDDYLAPHLEPKHPYSNLFSISRSIKADGYDELVRRNGGSADYIVTSVLGGQQGTQTVTVVSVEPTAGRATLMREGSSEGYFVDEPKQIKMGREGETTALNLIPGVSHWKGYTTFARGVVISDELEVTRTDVLRSNEGKEVTAFERRIMLLNASPTPAKGA